MRYVIIFGKDNYKVVKNINQTITNDNFFNAFEVNGYCTTRISAIKRPSLVQLYMDILP